METIHEETKNKVLTKEERETKVYNLALEIEQLTSKKKSTNKSFSEQLKELKLELKDVLTQAGESVN